MIRPARQIVATYRDAFGGLPARTWLLCLAGFINRCGSMVLPFLNIFMGERFRYSPGQAGGVVALYGVGAVVGSLLGGRLADAIGCVRAQIAMLSLAGLWMFVLSQVEVAWVFVAGTFVLGCLNDAFRPGSITAVANSVGPELRRKALSLNRLMMNAGWAVGPTVGGVLTEIDFRLMFYADGGTSLLAALFLWLFLRGYETRGAPKAPDLRGPFHDRRFLWLMALNVVVTVAFMQYFTTGSRVFQEVYGYDNDTIGYLLAINPVLIIVLEMPVVHHLRTRAALPVIALGSLLIGIGFLCYLPPLGMPGAVLALVVITLGEVLQMPLLGAFVNDHAPPGQRAAYNGAYGMSFSSALVAAPYLGGWAFEYLGASMLWLLCGLSAGLGALGFWRARRG